MRGYETDAGEMVVITDEEFESVAPEMSGDIDLRSFVPLEQIPAIYFQKPYFLAPAGKSAKAYHLLAATMERTGRVGIGSFVMRGHEYLVAILSDNGVLRADTLRYADEIRQPESIGLPKRAKAPAKAVNQFVKDIDELTRKELNMSELEDQEAEALQDLVKTKQKDSDNVIHQSGLESADADDSCWWCSGDRSDGCAAQEPVKASRRNERTEQRAHFIGCATGRPEEGHLQTCPHEEIHRAPQAAQTRKLALGRMATDQDEDLSQRPAKSAKFADGQTSAIRSDHHVFIPGDLRALCERFLCLDLR